MSQLSSIKLGITKKLCDPGYRHRFFARMTQDEVASQIRTLREKRGLRQTDLAKQAKMKQPFVSRIEQSEHASWNFQTLLRLASALDARLHIFFEPMENVIRQYEWEEGAAFASKAAKGYVTEGAFSHLITPSSAATVPAAVCSIAAWAPSMAPMFPTQSFISSTRNENGGIQPSAGTQRQEVGAITGVPFNIF
jgi:HTH-type transcriptional regulator / antitoxin HipB